MYTAQRAQRRFYEFVTAPVCADLSTDWCYCTTTSARRLRQAHLFIHQAVDESGVLIVEEPRLQHPRVLQNLWR